VILIEGDLIADALIADRFRFSACPVGAEVVSQGRQPLEREVVVILEP